MLFHAVGGYETAPNFLPCVVFLWTRVALCCRISGVSVKWKVEELEECESTFNVARKLPAWTVVSSVRQTKGRGRFNRTWFGDEGGLWATYNLPIDPRSPLHWGLLPLVAGAAIMDALRPYRIPGLRLRWPNDVLIGKEKLAGILVERPAATMASIGIGVNMFNSVTSVSSMTLDPPARLADYVSPCPSVNKFRTILGDDIAETFHYFLEGGLDAISPMLETAWGDRRPVVAITDTDRICGFFAGVEDDGSPILSRPDGSRITVPGITVNRLKELI